MKFSELHLNGNVLEALDAMRFEECTPIQEQSIPVILEGRDLIAVAQTGTGKTAAYLLPILNKLSEGGHPADAINCIVMAPTRELAQQIDQQMEGFSYFMPVSSVAVYGGNDGVLFEQQKRGLTLGADVVIATPGRLIAHLSLGYVDLSRVSYLFWMKQTGCWIWDLSMTSNASSFTAPKAPVPVLLCNDAAGDRTPSRNDPS